VPNALDNILSKLQKATKNGDGWLARCPAHKDGRPSLSIKVSDSGKILFHCFAGCTTPAVCNALGIRERDLFPESPNGPGAFTHPRDLPIVAEYVYRDETGKPCLRVTRHPSTAAGKKDFKQWRHARDGWKLGTKAKAVGEIDAKYVLYRLPEILEAIALEHTVYVVEGEKDANNLALAGLDATTPAGGAAAKWLDHYTASLAGAYVVVIADKDEPGRKKALEICQALHGAARSVKYLELPGRTVKDASDFLKTGATARQITALADAAPLFDPNNPPEPLAEDDLPDLDNLALVAANPPPLPALLIDDLLHERLKMILGAPSKAHKSWVLLDLAVSVAAGARWLGFTTHQKKVLYLNFEIPREFAIKRAIEICHAKGIPFPANLMLWNLRGADTRAEILIPKIIRRCIAEGFGLIVVDPAYKLQGNDYDENSAASVHKLLRQIESLATDLQAAIVTAAHFAKGSAAGKDALDRISGSGVFARDPDVFVTLTPHATDDCFTVEARVRNLRAIPKFVVRLNFPLLVREEALDPEDLKQPAKTVKTGYGHSRKAPPEDILLKILPVLGCFDVTQPRHGVFNGAQVRKAFQDLGYHKDTVKDAITLAVDAGQIATVRSSLLGGESFYGIPTAIELWKPKLADLDKAEREARKAGKKP
jgi:hypothetical protein